MTVSLPSTSTRLFLHSTIASSCLTVCDRAARALPAARSRRAPSPRRTRSRRSPRARAGAGSTPRRLPGRAFLLPRLPGSPRAPPPRLRRSHSALSAGGKGAARRRRQAIGAPRAGGEVLAHQPRAAAERLVEVAERGPRAPTRRTPRRRRTDSAPSRTSTRRSPIGSPVMIARSASPESTRMPRPSGGTGSAARTLFDARLGHALVLAACG